MFVSTLLAAFGRKRLRLQRSRTWPRVLYNGWSLCALGLVTLFVVAFLHPLGTWHGSTRSQLAVSLSPNQAMSGAGKGAGGFGDNGHSFQTPTVCAPFDASCLTSGIALSIAQGFITAFQPLTDDILSDPSDITIQTPPQDSFQDPSVTALNGLFVETVDAALACLLLIGGYTVMVGSSVQMRATLAELLPRAVLVVLAVQTNLTFLGTFITLANTLSLAVYQAAQVQSFANLLASFLTFDPSTGLLVILGSIILVILGLALLLQMIARIALVALLIVVAPLGLSCFLLPQTVRWGRLWLMSFTTIVLVQFLQVTTLGLGVAFLTSIGTAGFLHLGLQLARIFLTIGTLGVVLKIPGLLQKGILFPMIETGQGNNTRSDAQNSEGDASFGDLMDGGAGGSDGSIGFDFSSGGGWGDASTSGGSAFGNGSFGGGSFVDGQIITDANGDWLLTFLA